MLPPFRIRHLRASDNPAGPDLGDDFLSSPIHQDEDALVAISEPEYDSLISRHPEAALSYLDEDDGEIITVGWFFSRARSAIRGASSRGRPTHSLPARPSSGFPLPLPCSFGRPPLVHYFGTHAHIRLRQEQWRYGNLETYDKCASTPGPKDIFNLFP